MPARQFFLFLSFFSTFLWQLLSISRRLRRGKKHRADKAETHLTKFLICVLTDNVSCFQERLREEVNSVELKDVSKLPYLDRVIRESQRLYPSVPFISRQVNIISTPKCQNLLTDNVNRQQSYSATK